MSEKRKIKVREIEGNFEECAIVIKYENIGSEESSFGEKKVRLKTLDGNTNVQMLAEEVVKKCKLLSSSKTKKVESVIKDLQMNLREMDVGKKSQVRRSEPLVMARYDHLEEYIDALYDDDVEKKVEGTIMIGQLGRKIALVEEIIQNEALMGLLSRVLSEEYKKSYDLVLAMMKIFMYFSAYIQMHEILAGYRIGSITIKMIDFELKRHAVRMEDEENAKDGSSRAKRKLKEVMKKQDKLFLVGFMVLYQLAEDYPVEKKMVKKGIVSSLIAVLSRESTDLVILATTFLKKLCVFEENKNTMLEQGCIEQLCKYVPCNSIKLIQAILKLFYNLSFDPMACEIMVGNGFLPKLVELLKQAPFRALTLRLLYHLSIDDKCKSMFAYTEGIPIVRQLMIHFPQTMIARELVALAINLTYHARNAELMCQNGSIKHLMERVVRTKDPLLMKVIRNLTQWTLNTQSEVISLSMYKYSGMWYPYVVPLLKICMETDDHDMLVESMGALGNITPADIGNDGSWSAIVEKYSVFQYLHKLLVPGFSHDDVVLEIVNLIASISLDPSCCTQFRNSRLLTMLNDLLRDKIQDDELVLQLLFTFYRLMRHSDLVEEILYSVGLLPQLLAAARSSNPEVISMCDQVMDLILDKEMQEGILGEFGRQIRASRFRAHNAVYLQAAEENSTFHDYAHTESNYYDQNALSESETDFEYK